MGTPLSKYLHFHVNQREAIPAHIAPILERLNSDSEQWLKSFHSQQRPHRKAFWAIEKLQQYCRHWQQRWLWGMRTRAG